MSSFVPSYQSTINNVSTNFSDRVAGSQIHLNKDILSAFHAKTQFLTPNRCLMMGTPPGNFGEQFPSSWVMGAPSYHTPGTRLLGGTPPLRNFRQIILDDRLVTHLFLDEQDQRARSVVQFSPMMGQEMGQSIAQYVDQQAAIVIALAARASSNFTGTPALDSGLQLNRAGSSTNLSALNAAIWDAKNSFDEKNVPESGRTLALRPAQFNLLAAAFNDTFHRTATPGPKVSATVPSYAGFDEILWSNNIPSTNIATNPSGAQNTYSGNFTATNFLAWHRSAFGCLYTDASLSHGGATLPSAVTETDAKMMPVDIRTVKIDEAYGDLFLASVILGMSFLLPRCAIEGTDS